MTISAPHMHAHCLEWLSPYLTQNKKAVNALDIGSGSGYLTVCLKLLGAKKVVGIEYIKPLV